MTNTQFFKLLLIAVIVNVLCGEFSIYIHQSLLFAVIFTHVLYEEL